VHRTLPAGQAHDAVQNQEGGAVIPRAQGRCQPAIPVIPSINRWRRDQ